MSRYLYKKFVIPVEVCVIIECHKLQNVYQKEDDCLLWCDRGVCRRSLGMCSERRPLLHCSYVCSSSLATTLIPNTSRSCTNS